MRERVARYYSAKLAEHGATPLGVDWKTAESQELRFTQLLTACRPELEASILDFGCGYGALAARLRQDGRCGTYCGYDVSKEMVAAATSAQAGLAGCTFTSDASMLRPVDYTLASGIFNVRMDIDTAGWEGHVRQTLDTMAGLSRRGFAFNMLTRYADAERTRPDLYYADPGGWLTYCLDRFSRHAALLHDYPLYEFTLFVQIGATGNG